ncbi:hypothetical protein [Parasphingorhabdus sp.]|uniref:hypothetical protein n=1 Tax=Parasphingorhabdus sp. TaxID=2709688 RepID=UPI003263A00D
MSTPIFKITALAMLLTACDNRADNGARTDAEQQSKDEPIKCAVNGTSEFVRDCAIERLSGDGKVTLIIRHPDGGFRRFNILTDGHGLEAADGFEAARISIVEDGEILVQVGPDQYLLPARIKPGAETIVDENPGPVGN